MIEKVDHILVDQCETAEELFEVNKLILCRQKAMQKEISYFYKRAVGSQVFNGIASVIQDSFTTLEIGDTTGTGAGVHVAAVQGDIPGFFAQIAYVNCPFSLCSFYDRQGVCFAFYGKFCSLTSYKFIFHIHQPLATYVQESNTINVKLIMLPYFQASP